MLARQGGGHPLSYSDLFVPYNCFSLRREAHSLIRWGVGGGRPLRSPRKAEGGHALPSFSREARGEGGSSLVFSLVLNLSREAGGGHCLRVAKEAECDHYLTSS